MKNCRAQSVETPGKTVFLSGKETGGKSPETAGDAYVGKIGLDECRFCIRRNKDRNRNKRFYRN